MKKNILSALLLLLLGFFGAGSGYIVGYFGAIVLGISFSWSYQLSNWIFAYTPALFAGLFTALGLYWYRRKDLEKINTLAIITFVSVSLGVGVLHNRILAKRDEAKLANYELSHKDMVDEYSQIWQGTADADMIQISREKHVVVLKKSDIGWIRVDKNIDNLDYLTLQLIVSLKSLKKEQMLSRGTEKYSQYGLDNGVSIKVLSNGAEIINVVFGGTGESGTYFHVGDNDTIYLSNGYFDLSNMDRFLN